MKVHEYNEMMAYMLRPRQKFAIGGGVIEGQGLGTREGFATIEKLTQRYANKPGGYSVRNKVVARDVPLSELQKLPGFIRKTTEDIIFDTLTNAKSFVNSKLAKDAKKAALSTDAKSEAKKLKNRKPKLFNRIMKLAEEGKTSVQKIGEDPEVVKLNNGKTIKYGTIQRIITDEKGEEFFKKVAETKQPFIGEIRKGALENLDNIMDDYYSGMGTKKLTKKYFPNSPDAKANASSTVLETVINENIDPVKLANRPAAIGSNQFGTREEQIKVLKEFQDYLAKNTEKFTSKATTEANLKSLFEGSKTDTLRNFVFRANSLRKIYNDKTPPEGFKINEKVKNLIRYIPAQDFIEEELRALGFSERTIKSMVDVETAVQKITSSSTMFEHALPRSLIRMFNLPKKFYLAGERTSNFLNKFKMQFDGQLKTAAEAYAQSDQSPADYKKYKTKVKKIRDKVRKYTGGYEIGYVDFDKNGRAIPITPQSSMLEGEGELGKRTTGIKNFFKNMQFHNRLFENHKKNKNNPDFYTLNDEINNSKLDFTPEYEIEKEYDKIKNFKKVSQFQNYFKTAPESSFFKSLFTGRGGRVALTATTGATLATLLMAAGPKEKGLTTEEVMARKEQNPSFIEEYPYLVGTTAAASPLLTKKGRKIYGGVLKGGLRAFGSVPSGLGFSASQFVNVNPFSDEFGELQEDPNIGLAGVDLLFPEIGKRLPLKGTSLMSRLGSYALNPFQLAEKASRFGKVGRGIASLARVPSLMTPVGLTLMGAEGIMMGMREQERINQMRETDPEAYQEFIADQEDMLRESAAYGGRMGFDEGGPSDPSRRKFMKIMGGLASLPIVGKFFRVAEQTPVVQNIFTEIQKLKNSETIMPDWFPTFLDKFRREGVAENIFKKKKVEVSKAEYDKAFAEGKGENYYTDVARTQEYKANNPDHMDYYKLEDTDELIGTTYTNEKVPGVKVDDFDGEVSVNWENDYSQPVSIEYVKPGGIGPDMGRVDKFQAGIEKRELKPEGEFAAVDQEVYATDPDGGFDTNAVIVESLDDMMEGTTRVMEEYATGKPVRTLSKGEGKVIEAEVRAGQMAKDTDATYEGDPINLIDDRDYSDAGFDDFE